MRAEMVWRMSSFAIAAESAHSGTWLYLCISSASWRRWDVGGALQGSFALRNVGREVGGAVPRTVEIRSEVSCIR